MREWRVRNCRDRSWVVAAFGLFLAVFLAAGSAVLVAHDEKAATTYVCPMHPEVTAAKPGKCPKCGMTLVKVDPHQHGEDFVVDVETTPAAPKPGEPTRLRLVVRDPQTRAVVKKFAVVHDKPFHLFVVSQDLEVFDHVHPEPQADGSFVVQLTLPRPGRYKLFSDFLPAGGTPQVIAGQLVTANYREGATATRAHLVPDTQLTKAVADMKITLKLPAGGLHAGREEKLVYDVADAHTGKPVTNLQPYLGAFGHTLILSEDATDYVHAHPHESPEAGKPAAGGPRLTFEAQLPKRGRYRIWTQVQRGGVVSAAVFTVEASGPQSTAAKR